ncbi:Exodeoxyribonuclease 7 large subunit [Tepidimonas fonticaldi]|uniref:Exodeoxyribonuclease 7 large subunit n=1 Tax=Tepidimonas fonticaldi TaxID=1101373 RepID=A0A554XNG3_9BURK|nr:exodeoxyribonuclease VII large subunit [Tepidimonas fonticaldi]TSE37366.1 Exodeoxyribonuclease 7 large subunit [Tepidimonas fonticaldi]
MSGSPWPPSDDEPAWPVGALVAAVADALRARFNPVRVSGEVAGYLRAGSGHAYFTLKDAQGQLRCAFFRRAAEVSAVALRDGLRIEVLGRLDVYAPRGDLQLVVKRVRLAGQGDLYERFLRLKATLQAEGLFESARKRPLPAFPASVGVVTSLDAAALRDVATTLARRVPHLPVRLYPAAVQGADAPAQLCAALRRAYQDHRDTGAPAVLLLVRGGGSLEDLWAFNDPDLVRTMAQAPMPIVCGVGHETDVTLADFVADVRAPTPTAAAELCAPAAATLREALQRQAERLSAALWRRIDAQAQHLDRLAQRLGRPSALTARERARLQAHEHRLERALALRIDRQRQHLLRLEQAWQSAGRRDTERRRLRLERWGAQLALLDPQLVLQRGYALVTDAQGHVVTRADQTAQDAPLHVALAAGRLDVRVSAVHAGPAP